MQSTREYSSQDSIRSDENPDVPRPTGEEARQGVTGHNVRYVLALSLGGALIALAAVWMIVA